MPAPRIDRCSPRPAELQWISFDLRPKIVASAARVLGTLAAIRPGMMRNVTWTMLGATIAVALGLWVELFPFGDPRALIAALIGGALGLIGFGGRYDTSIVDLPREDRTSGALSVRNPKEIARDRLQ